MTSNLPSMRGDLIQLALAGTFDVVIHGCNCQRTMGAGIALAIRRAFPEAYAADQRTEHASRAKLGTISAARIIRPRASFTVVNAYTQFHWRGHGVLVDYEAVRLCMRIVKARFTGLRIGYPRIGAGLARGDWTRIAEIIANELAGETHTLVELP